MNRDAVTDGLPVDFILRDRLGEGVARSGFDGIFNRQFDPDGSAMGAEIRDGLKRRDAGKFERFGHRFS